MIERAEVEPQAARIGAVDAAWMAVAAAAQHSTPEPRRPNGSTIDMTKNRPMIPAKLTQITR